MRAICPNSWKTPLLLATATERARIQADIGALVADMNRSIAEADRFIKDMTPARD